jgi:hypothetical protein
MVKGTIEDYISLERTVAGMESIRIPSDCPFSFENFQNWASTQKRQIIVRKEFGVIYIIDIKEWR